MRRTRTPTAWAAAAILGLAALGAVPTGASAAVGGRDAKLGSVLQALSATPRAARPTATAVPASGDTRLQLDGAGRVLVDVTLSGTAAAARSALTGAGLQIIAANDLAPYATASGWIAPDALAALAALDAVRDVAAALGGDTDFGPVLSQGDARHNGPAARTLGGGIATGAGVKVGIISDSFDEATGSSTFASAEFPGPVGILSDDDAGGQDEGRAMGEIVADEAPGIASLTFASGTAAAASKVAAINSLVAAGVKVIADDVPMIDEPFFQDGQVAQAVDTARAAGVIYFASAGNRARQSWEGRFTPSGGIPPDNLFSGADVFQTVATVPAGGTLRMAIQWDEPWGHATTDLNAYLVNADATATVLQSSTDPNTSTDPGINKGGNPRESIRWKNTTGATVTTALRIRRAAVNPGTSGTPLIKWLALDDFTPSGPLPPPEYATGSGAINPDAASAVGALAVAAVNQGDSGLDTPEAFSSRGPATRLFSKDGVRLAQPEVRQKPDLAAADCVATSVSTPDRGPGLPAHNFFSFCGTSAAAPAAAGIAALIRSARPSLSADQVAAIMTNPANAIDCTATPGVPDPDCGAGFLLADRAVGAAIDTTPPKVAAATVPAVPDGTNGWFRTPPKLTWTVTDPEAPVLSTSGCDPGTVVVQGTTTVSCTATTAGGTTTTPLTVRLDTAPPSPPTAVGLPASQTPIPLNELPIVTCTATDATSGLKGCVADPLDATRGTHLLGMVATDNAGLTSSAVQPYTVGPAIDRIRPRLTRALLARRLTIRLLTRTGYKLSGTGLPGGRITVRVVRGATVLARGSAVARQGIVKLTLKAKTAKARRLVRAARGREVSVVAIFVATSGSTGRSSATRTISRLTS